MSSSVERKCAYIVYDSESEIKAESKGIYPLFLLYAKRADNFIYIRLINDFDVPYKQ